MQMNSVDGQLTLFDLDSWCGKTFPEPSPAENPRATISGSSSKKPSELRSLPYQSLDLSPDAGNLLGESYWEIRSPWRGDALTLNTGVSPREERESSLSRILQETVPDRYYLTPKACRGILRRADERGKELPERLKRALEIQAGMALQEGISPKLKATESKTNTVPSILCLNDQGGSYMNCSENKTGTLCSQMNSHQPLVYENHGIDSRYTGPHRVAPTMSACYGTGGNNVPLVEQACAAKDTVDRPAVYSRQRVDVFKGDSVAGTQSARQDKDATDLVYQKSVGALTESDRKGINNQYVSQGKCVVENSRLIRRLTPLECERLQGFPDGWTDIPAASVAARYKALGNSVAIPCVDYVLHGIALALWAEQ